MKLYVVRHGQTEWNYENRVSGVSDVKLTDKGEEQANELSKIINEKQIDIILLHRCQEQLKQLKYFQVQLVKTSLLTVDLLSRITGYLKEHIETIIIF